MSLSNNINFPAVVKAISNFPFLGCDRPVKSIETEIVPFSLFQNQLIDKSSSPLQLPTGDASLESEKIEETKKSPHIKRYESIVCPSTSIIKNLLTRIAHIAFTPPLWLKQHSPATDYIGCLPYYRQILTPQVTSNESFSFLETLSERLSPFHELIEPILCSEPFLNWFLDDEPPVSAFPITAREDEQFMRAAISARGEEVLTSVGFNYQGNIADLVKYAIEKAKEKRNPAHQLIYALPSEFRESRKWMEQIVDGFGALAFEYALGDLRNDPDFFQHVRKQALKELNEPNSEGFPVFEYSKELKADKEIMMRAIDKFNRYGFIHADEALKKDPEFFEYARKKMIEEVRNGGAFIFYLPAPFKEDPIVIQDAIDQFGWKMVSNFLSSQEQEAIQKKLKLVP